MTCSDPLRELGLEPDVLAPSQALLWAGRQLLGLFELTGVLLCSFCVPHSSAAVDHTDDVWQVSKSRQVLGVHFF